MALDNSSLLRIILSSKDQAILTSIYICIAIVGSISNLLIVVAVICTKGLRRRQHLVLLNLVVADICVICIATPYNISSVNIDKPRKTDVAVALCKTYCFLSYALGYISILSMLLISLDRYLAIVYPYLYRVRVTSRKLAVACISCWLIPVISCLFATIIPGWVGFDGRPGGFCGVQWSNVEPAYVCLLIGIMFLIPTCLIFYTNTRVFLIARRQKRTLHAESRKHDFNCHVFSNRVRTILADSDDKSSMKSRIRRRLSMAAMTKSVSSRDVQIACATLLLIGFYLVSWLPFVIPRIFFTFNISVPEQLTSYSPAFAFSNVAWDPMLILWSRNEIRKSIRALFKKLKNKWKMTSSSSASVIENYDVQNDRNNNSVKK